MYPPLRDEALVNFGKKSERLTLHGVTGFTPLYYLCYLYYMLYTYYKRYLYYLYY